MKSLQPLIQSKSERIAYDVLGDRYTLLLSAEETGGAYSLFDFEVPPGRGSPPHIHSREDESFFVLSGEVDFMVDGKVTRAKAGDVVFGPRGIKHNFSVAGTSPARMICLTSPGGFEHFFAAVGSVVTDKNIPPRPPSEEDIKRVGSQAPLFGLVML